MKNLLNDVDVIFTALPNGEAQKISNKLKEHNTLIDLSADFRLKNSKSYFKYYKIKHSSIKNIPKAFTHYLKLKISKLKILKLLDVLDVTQHQYYYL